MNSLRTRFPVAAVALAFATAVALAQDAPRPEAAPEPSPAGRGDRPAWKRGRGRAMQRFRAGRMLRSEARTELRDALRLTDEQRRVVLEKARAAAPLVEEHRRELARRIVADEQREETAGGATPTPAPTPEERRKAREERRAAHRALKDAFDAKVAPLAKDVVATLTAEQRARLEGFAAARGRKLTDEALERFVRRVLTRPMTVPLLEARLGSR